MDPGCHAAKPDNDSKQWNMKQVSRIRVTTEPGNNSIRCDETQYFSHSLMIGFTTMFKHSCTQEKSPYQYFRSHCAVSALIEY